MSEQTKNRIKLVVYSIFPIIASYLLVSYKVNTLNVIDGIIGVILAAFLFVIEMRILIHYKFDPDFQNAAYQFCCNRTRELNE